MESGKGWELWFMIMAEFTKVFGREILSMEKVMKNFPTIVPIREATLTENLKEWEDITGQMVNSMKESGPTG